MTSSEELDPTVTIRKLVQPQDQNSAQIIKVSESETRQSRRTASDSTPTLKTIIGKAGGAGISDDPTTGHTSPQSRRESPGGQPGAAEIGSALAAAPTSPARDRDQHRGAQDTHQLDAGAATKAGAAAAMLSAAEQDRAIRQGAAINPASMSPVVIVDDMADVAEGASALYREQYARVMGSFHAGRLIGGDLKPIKTLSDAKAMAAFRANQLNSRAMRKNGR